jgi:hypothetical protein
MNKDMTNVRYNGYHIALLIIISKAATMSQREPPAYYEQWMMESGPEAVFCWVLAP